MDMRVLQPKIMWNIQVKSVCTASLEEGHKHGVVRTPQEEGEALDREEVGFFSF